MKKNIVLTSVILGMTATSILYTGCSKPTERPSVVNSKIAANLFALSDLNEITNEKAKAVFYTGSKKAEVSKLDGSLKQMKLEGQAQNLLNLVKGEDTKKMLDDHLTKGAVAIVVLNDQIKILKVVPETDSSFDLTLTSLAYLSKLKALVKTSDVKQQNQLASYLESIKDKSPSDLKEPFGLAEITAIKIEKHGNLDNERTDYNEKKSILNIVERPFEVSTHIVVGSEVGTESEDASAKVKTEEEK